MTGRRVEEIPVRKIKIVGDNPRFSVGDIKGLADSINEQGLLQPLVVSPARDGNYNLVCGHRRFAAVKYARYTHVECVVTDVPKRKRLEAMVVENIHRRTMSPIEEGEAFKKIIDEQGITMKELGKRIGKSDTYVSFRVAALSLPKDIQQKIHNKEMSLQRALDRYRQRRTTYAGTRPQRTAFKPLLAQVHELSDAIRKGDVDWSDNDFVYALQELLATVVKSPLKKLLETCERCGEKATTQQCCKAHKARLCGECFDQSHRGAA